MYHQLHFLSKLAKICIKEAQSVYRETKDKESFLKISKIGNFMPFYTKYGLNMPIAYYFGAII